MHDVCELLLIFMNYNGSSSVRYYLTYFGNTCTCLQNTAALIRTDTKLWEHITPVLMNMHWLPVQERATLKILVFAYKYIQGLVEFSRIMYIPY